MTRRLSIVLSILLLAGIAPARAAETGWKAKVDASVLSAARLGPTDVIVYMQRRADLSLAARMPGKAAKGSFVYETLTNVASNSQAGLLEQLAAAAVTFDNVGLYEE